MTDGTNQFLAVALVIIIGGCDDTESMNQGAAGAANAAGQGQAGQAAMAGQPAGGAGTQSECIIEEKNELATAYQHVESCSYINYESIPPTSGDHYPVWPAFKTYQSEIPQGFMVHGLEHGGVIVFYNCPDGCAEELEEVNNWQMTLPIDPQCIDVPRRLIVAPEPRLPSRFAAVAWEWVMLARCFDGEKFTGFYKEHYAKSPENICSNGPDLEGMYPPVSGCGEEP